MNKHARRTRRAIRRHGFTVIGLGAIVRVKHPGTKRRDPRGPGKVLGFIHLAGVVEEGLVHFPDRASVERVPLRSLAKVSRRDARAYLALEAEARA